MKDDQPVVPPTVTLPEITPKAVVLSVILAAVLMWVFWKKSSSVSLVSLVCLVYVVVLVCFVSVVR